MTDDHISLAVAGDPVRDVPGSLDLVPAEQVRVLLEIGAEELWELVVAGRLCAVVVDGRAWFSRTPVQAMAMDFVNRRADEVLSRIGPLGRALRAFLDDRPAVGDYATAQGTRDNSGPPLVTARRGGTYRYYGIQYHRIAFPVRALARFVGQHTEYAGIPAGPALLRDLLRLDGIREIHNVTPLIGDDGDGSGKSMRVRNWVAIDPLVWTDVPLEPRVARIVAGEAEPSW